MKSALRAVALAAVLCIVGFNPAFAGKLTADQVKNFVSAIPEVEVFANDMRATGKDKELEKAAEPKPGDDSFTPYQKSIVLMKEKFPEDYSRLGNIVTRHGFASQESWASAGDDVMLAYMAIKMGDQGRKSMEAIAAMPEEAKASLSPEARAQMEQAVHMMEIIGSVPAENKTALEPHLASIDQWLERGRQQAEQAQSASPAAAQPQAQ